MPVPLGTTLMLIEGGRDMEPSQSDSFGILAASNPPGVLNLEPTLRRDFLVSNSPRFRWTVPSHANSNIQIIAHKRLIVRGFLNGTATYFPGARFLVDGKIIGSAYEPHDLTKIAILEPGIHRLEIKCVSSKNGGDTVWGLDLPELEVQDPIHYLTIGSSFKDGNEYLEDWLKHHLKLGVSHVYLLDRGSKIPLQSTIDELGFGKKVTVERYLGEDLLGNPDGYQELLRKFGSACRWMALIEPDQYLVLKLGDDLPRFISAYEDFGALKVRWMEFGANGHAHHQPDRVGSFTDCFEGRQFNCIVQPRFVVGLTSAQEVETMAGRPVVGEHFDDQTSTSLIQVNQYWTRSMKDWAKRTGMNNKRGYWSIGRRDFDHHQLKCRYRDIGVKQAVKIGAEANRRVTGFIHVAATNHWQAILRSQIRKIVSSGLLDVCESVRIGICGADDSVREELDFLPDKVSVMFCRPGIHQFEYPTLLALQQYCRANVGDVFYIHSKGSVHVADMQHPWRSRMEAAILIHHELMRAKLAEGYDAAAGHGAPDPAIPGNFWWTRSEHVAKLPDFEKIDWSNRFHAEHWIESIGSERFFWLDFGGSLFKNYRILKSQPYAGRITTNGHHGWVRQRVLFPKEWAPADQVISAHAPAAISIEVTASITIYGFLSDSCQPGNWLAECVVDGVHLGSLDEMKRRTTGLTLRPGRHVLEIRITRGDPLGAHTCWAVHEEAIDDPAAV